LISQFDIFENPNRKVRATLPFVVAIQSDFSVGDKTVIVAPVAPRERAKIDEACAPITLDDKEYVVLFQGLAAFPKSALGKPLAKVEELRDHLPRAIDYLFLGL
jgi:hypothetical protein